jgi:hypothetical protein
VGADAKGETISYEQFCEMPGTVTFHLTSHFERDAQDPDSIVVEIYYIRWEEEAGVFRASAYNGAGESPLSDTELVL